MKKITMLLTVLTGLLTGCVNDALVKSYAAYQNTIGKEYKCYLRTGKKPSGKKFTKSELLARRLNLKAAESVLRELKK